MYDSLVRVTRLNATTRTVFDLTTRYNSVRTLLGQRFVTARLNPQSRPPLPFVVGLNVAPDWPDGVLVANPLRLAPSLNASGSLNSSAAIASIAAGGGTSGGGTFGGTTVLLTGATATFGALALDRPAVGTYALTFVPSDIALAPVTVRGGR